MIYGMNKLTVNRSLLDAYRFDRFRTKSKVQAHPQYPTALVIMLARHQKKLSAGHVGRYIELGMIEKSKEQGILVVETGKSIWNLIFEEWTATCVSP